MSELDQIPRADLIEMLKGAAWYSGGSKAYDREGYSYDVAEETAIRDVNYRDELLYPTPEAAIMAHWERHHKS